MVGTYDETTARAYPDYPGGTSLQRWHRQLLREVMESEGFTVYEAEWWHFDYKDWQKYRIGNVRFEQIVKSRRGPLDLRPDHFTASNPISSTESIAFPAGGLPLILTVKIYFFFRSN